jgi:hypothetical protein
MLKIAVFAPTPKARESNRYEGKTATFKSSRKPYRTS